jgi:hypothetical protein
MLGMEFSRRPERLLPSGKPITSTVNLKTIAALSSLSVILGIAVVISSSLQAEDPDTSSKSKELEVLRLVEIRESEIPKYTARRNPETDPIIIDGKLDEPGWKSAIRSPRFVDLITGKPVKFDTHASVLWDDEFLYVGYRIEEPDVRAALTRRDAPIYSENDVELFIDGGGGYYEFEINALGTLYEAFFIWEEAYDKHYAAMPEFRRDQPGVISFNGVGFKKHPRGKRIGFMRWDFQKLRSAVHVDGTLNDSSDTDNGWTVELALPWKSMAGLAQADDRSLPPKGGDTWRIDFSRFNQYRSDDDPASNGSKGWAWSRHGVWDSHIPECFVRVTFSAEDVVSSDTKSG